MKLKSFTADPRAIGRYGEVEDEGGTRRFTVKVRGEVKGLVIARLSGVEDRNAAEALKGLRLYIGREQLPKPKRGEWYAADLIGLKVEKTDGSPMGRVKSVPNYGAGDLIEVEREGGTSFFLPFTKRVVPEVDVEGGRIVVDPPLEVEVKGETEARADEKEEDE